MDGLDRQGHRSAWRRGAIVAVAGALLAGGIVELSMAAPAPAACQTTAFTSSAGESKVVPIDVRTGTVDLAGISVAQGALANEVAVTPDGTTVFVVLSGTNSVVAISVATHAIVADIPVGDDPQDVDVTPDGKTAFVTNFSANSVSTINVATLTKDPTDIAVGTGPQGVAISPDGTLAAVSNFSDDTVSFIDVATRAKEPADIPVGKGPAGLRFTPNGATVFVADQDGFPDPDPGKTGQVSTIDVATRTADPVAITGFEHPNDLAITPDGKTAFVTNFGSDTISTIDVATRTKGAVDLQAGARPNAIAITPDGTTVYAVNLDSANVTQIDVATMTAITDLAVGGGPSGVAFTPCAVPPPPTTTTTTTVPPAPVPQPVPVTPAYTG